MHPGEAPADGAISGTTRIPDTLRPAGEGLSRGDRWLIAAGCGGLFGLAVLLWSVNGPGAFASMLTGLWAMCF